MGRESAVNQQRRRGRWRTREGNFGLTLEVAGDVVLDLIVARRAEKEGPVHQGELLEHWQGSVAQSTVDHVPLAGAESRQDEPEGGSQRNKGSRARS